MIIAIHQPNYLPYLGFFDKMRQADIFVIYDDAQFNKEDFQHRNKIRIFHGWKWLTIPVEKMRIPINDIRIKNEINNKGLLWSDRHFKDIMDNYKDTPYYQTYEKELKDIFKQRYKRLIDLNMQLIHFIKCAFNLDTEIIYSSELGFKSTSTERLVNIIEALEGDIYLSGPIGQKYLDPLLFEKKGIKVEFQDFKPPIYRQCYDGFIPNMSAIDALFNIGKLPEKKGLV